MLKRALLILCVIAARAQQLTLSEAELRPYDGTDPVKSIYLAINGTIYDVSASPSFYGPGGNYHHFTGRDASRAWVTECWDAEDQLTWRMDDVEKMFLPKYMDEELEKVSEGGVMDLNLGGVIGSEMISALAEKALERLGRVTDEEKAKRREEDAEEARQKVHETLAKWVGFFANNAKYQVVRTVVLDEDATPAPPAICEKAMQRRPIKGGKLDALMNVADMGKKIKGEEDGEMPNFVKAKFDGQWQKQGADTRVKNEL